MGVCSSKVQVRSAQIHSKVDKQKTADQKDICSVFGTDSYFELNEVDISKEYTISSHRLGEGSFGSVFKGSKVKDERRQYAIKQMNKDQDISQLTVRREVEIWSGLDHPFIARFYEAFSCPDSYMLVLEYCAGGDLVSKVSKLARMPEDTTSMIAYKIVKAVSYLHEHGISHRDIKPDNFLFKNAGGDDQTDIKLVDFGLSKKFSLSQLKTMVGTSYYVAPEVFDNSYTCMVDNWAIGATVYVLLCGRPPFLGANNKEILEAAIKNDIGVDQPVWSTLSPEAKDFISGLLKVDPLARSSLNEAMDHPWLKPAIRKVHDLAKAVELKGMKKRLCEFFDLNDLQKIVLLLWARSTLVGNQRIELMNLFLALDKDNQGIVSVEELDSWLQQADEGFTAAELDEVCSNIDSEFKGMIRYTHFLSMTVDRDLLFQDSDWLQLLFDLLAEEKDCKVAETSTIHRSILKLNHSNDFKKSCAEEVIQLSNGGDQVDIVTFIARVRLQ